MHPVLQIFPIHPHSSSSIYPHPSSFNKHSTSSITILSYPLSIIIRRPTSILHPASTIPHPSSFIHSSSFVITHPPPVVQINIIHLSFSLSTVHHPTIHHPSPITHHSLSVIRQRSFHHPSFIEHPSSIIHHSSFCHFFRLPCETFVLIFNLDNIYRPTISSAWPIFCNFSVPEMFLNRNMNV